MEQNNKRYWFKAKTYGYGWYPATWQGWLIILAYLIIFSLLAFIFETDIEKYSDFYFMAVTIITVLLVYISYKKGEPTKWRWGKKLNVVNDQDEVVGQASREKIHRDGLLHREIHIYFVTPSGQIIFQHRAKNKDTYPDLLDATVGGHVEIGDSYLDTAIKEAAEETGLKIEPQELICIGKTTRKSVDQSTGKINNAIRTSYLFIFDNDINNLKIEVGRSLGFEFWSLDQLGNISDKDSQRFISYILNFTKKELINFFDQYVSKNN